MQCLAILDWSKFLIFIISMIKKIIFLIYLVSSIIYFDAFGQHQDRNWYFGNGTDGIIFNSANVPVKVSNKYPNMGFEGICVVSHAWTGELLFYTDGIEVINKNHQVMTNGGGLLANFSGSQCVQVCKMPNECSKYYIVSNSSWDNTPGSLYYSIVDFTSLSLGQVTSKNTLINGPNYHQAMRIIPKLNSNNLWLIAHLYNTATYHVFEISPSGFSAPVVYNFSNSGRSWTMEYNEVTHKLLNMGEDLIKVTLFDFDPATGVLSNEQQLASSAITAARVGNFSDDGTKIYAGVSPGLTLWQYDLLTGTWTNMNTCCYAHDVKKGPDGLTYHIHTYSASNPLATMTNANLSAIGNACGYSTITSPGGFNGAVRRFPEFLVTAQPPVAVTDTLSMSTGGTVFIDVLANDYDPQGDIISFDSIVRQPSFGSAVFLGGQIQYTPNAFCSGSDTLSYLISDNTCLYDTAYVYINFIAQNPSLTWNTSIDTCNQIVSFVNTTSLAYNSLLWSFGDGQTDTSSSTIHTYLNAGVYQVSLTLSDNSGCLFSYSDTIEITNKPIPGFIFTLDTCTNTCTFINNSQYSNNYIWDFGDGTSYTVSSPTHVYTSGQYSVLLLAENGSCSDTISASFFMPVLSLPTASFVGLLDTCTSTINLLNNSSNYSTSNWIFSDGTSDTLTNPTHTFLANGMQSVYLQVTNQAGCADSTQQAIFVPVIQQAIALFSTSIDTCSRTITLSNNSTNATNYFWNLGDGNSSTVDSLMHVYAVDSTYYILLISSNSCNSDTIGISVNISVPLPVAASFNYLLDYCNMGIELNSLSTNSTNYFWDFGDGNFSSDSNTVHFYTQSGPYTLTLIAENSCFSDSSEINITIYSVLIANSSFVVQNAPCSQLVVFSNSSVNSINYSWDFGDGTFSTDSTPSHSYSLPGVYQVILIAYDSCFSDTSSFTIDLSLNQSPVVLFTALAQNCDTLAIPFLNQTLYANSFLWDFGDGQTDTASNPLHTFPAAGTYNVSLTAFNGCFSGSISFPVTVNSISVPSASFNYNIDTCTQIVTFINTSLNSTTYLWNFGDGSISNQASGTHQYNGFGSYLIILIVEPLSNCADTTEMVLILGESELSPFYIPNCFTPNDDGKNDVFQISSSVDCNDYYITILNRWGQVVYEGTSETKPWDGTYKSKDVVEGVYFYVFKSAKHSSSGNISLFR